jgi:hypothetical protein
MRNKLDNRKSAVANRSFDHVRVSDHFGNDATFRENPRRNCEPFALWSQNLRFVTNVRGFERRIIQQKYSMAVQPFQSRPNVLQMGTNDTLFKKSWSSTKSVKNFEVFLRCGSFKSQTFIVSRDLSHGAPALQTDPASPLTILSNSRGQRKCSHSAVTASYSLLEPTQSATIDPLAPSKRIRRSRFERAASGLGFNRSGEIIVQRASHELRDALLDRLQLPPSRRGVKILHPILVQWTHGFQRRRASRFGWYLSPLEND